MRIVLVNISRGEIVYRGKPKQVPGTVEVDVKQNPIPQDYNRKRPYIWDFGSGSWVLDQETIDKFEEQAQKPEEFANTVDAIIASLEASIALPNNEITGADNIRLLHQSFLGYLQAVKAVSPGNS